MLSFFSGFPLRIYHLHSYFTHMYALRMSDVNKEATYFTYIAASSTVTDKVTN